MKLLFSSNVTGELKEIGEHIARDKPGRSRSFIREIRAKFIQISRNPKLYRLRPEIGRTSE